ncbi:MULTISPECIES: toll/interleukin-1 receptor domain-containing protein [unclassified Streptomyces]|uniref:toll/interleukin-1 receptor domain-containing protein n=1 Tax=unclassified Streptomyces TaxID=2593676 RepID=UPI002DD8E57C|nr:toll/interleukin-1 receptor domain-containing protein [Streptomyces sp. NBC_00243]WRZ23975.1 toll/interleukin-1 receptor domain-containing protein [Streptomyces sp. NBC_00243]
MPDVFINYRTGDGEQVAATIQNTLSARFGPDRIYRASKSIPPGTPFDAHLIRSVRRSGVLLALIGPDWAGHRALHSENDWVRKEIQEAFQCDIRVIPVLLGRRTERPAKADLPAPLARLADCQSLRYDHQNDEYDLKRIGDALATLVPELAKVDHEAPAEPASGDVDNTTGDVQGTSVQAGTVNGDIGGVREAHGSVHIGPSTRSVRTGDGGNYFEGNNQGGIHQKFGNSRKEDDDR